MIKSNNCANAQMTVISDLITKIETFSSIFDLSSKSSCPSLNSSHHLRI